MRFLHWPTYSSPGNVATDSLYIIARNLIKVTPEVHSYLIVPDWGKKKVVKDELDDMPWCTKIPVKMLSHSRPQEAIQDEGSVWKFSPQIGEFPVEAVISHSPMRSLNIANAWSLRLEKYQRPVIATWDLLARDDRNMEYPADEIELIHNAAGTLVSDLNVHESEITESIAKWNAQKFLSPAATRRVVQSGVRREQGIDWKKLENIKNKVSKGEKFTVYYGGRFSASKRFDELCEIIDLVYSFGRDMRFIVCTGSISGGVMRSFVEKYPWVELHVGTNQDEAWAFQQQAHASICFSRGELFGMSFWEQIGGGLGVVMKTERWNEDMLPADYPLWAQDKVEAGAILRHLYNEWNDDPEEYERRHGWDSQWATYVRERYDMNVTLRGMQDDIVEIVEQRKAKIAAKWDRGVGQSLLELVSESIEDGTTFPELVEAMKKNSAMGAGTIGNIIVKGSSYSMLSAYQAAIYLGYVDDVNESIPTFRKA